MARIPLQVANRSLDTGNVVSYPSGSPVGAALEGFGNALQGAAERVRARDEQKDTFDATIRENELTASLAQLEDEAVQNAPADASGLHDSVYGQIDPVTQSAVKPGSFDKLFDDYLARVPESKRADFAAKKELYRLRGSARLAQQQYRGEQDYYKVEIQKTQTQITNAMAMADPSDTATFDQFKKQGLDIIDKSGLPALEKDVAKTNWLANADETLFKTLLAKDPEFAAKAKSALGLAPPVARGSAYRDAIASIESAGSGDYAAIGPRHPKLGRALGRYQIMEQNIGPWSQAALGRRVSVAEFMASEAIQDAIFDHRFGGYVKKYGEAGAAQAWFAGEGGVGKTDRKDVLGTSVGAYGQKFIKALEAGVGPDPRFANIPLERRLVLANQADVQAAEIERTALASMKAEYTQHKDALELQIVQGQIRDERLIANDGLLNDGDKATLITKVRTQNDGANQIAADFSALSDKSLVLDPYSSKDRTRADNLYSDATKRLPPEQHGAIAGAILEQTGVVPQPVVNSIRQGLSSQTPADVALAMQLAQRIASFDPAALARRDGGSEVQTAADDFSFYVNKMNLSPDEAARRLIEKNDPETKFNRKAMEPAAKEFLKTIEGTDLSSEFDTWFGSAPDVGFNEAQRLGIQAEFNAIAEDQFYRANGDPDLAKNRAVEEMKRLYGVTELTGRKVVMKHPPERYWPTFAVTDAAQSLSYPEQLVGDIKAFYPDADTDSIQLVTTPETDAMVKRGEVPGYAVLYKDKNGVLQTIPGKLWMPDFAKVKAQQDNLDAGNEAQQMKRARENQTEQREQAPYRVQGMDDFLSGEDPVFGER